VSTIPPAHAGWATPDLLTLSNLSAWMTGGIFVAVQFQRRGAHAEGPSTRRNGGKFVYLTITAEVQICTVPVLLPGQKTWKAPSLQAAIPAVSPPVKAKFQRGG